ncbi:MAG: DUF881 domain-containing protein [Ornithinimicrobium sp.]
MKLFRRPPATPNADPAASMALLHEVLDRPVDPGYRTAALTRSEAGLKGPTPSFSPLLIVTVLLLGFLMSTAALSLRAPDPQDASERAELAERVDAAGAVGDGYAAQIEGLRTQIAALEADASDGPVSGVAAQIDQAGLLAGANAVEGAGVLLTLDDAPSGDLEPITEPGFNSDRILASDLQTAVNGLWSVGAEAISINGHRLTSISSIRFAGEAIIVDFRGLSPPYEISVIGDPDALEAELSDGATSSYFDELSAQYGIVMEWERGTDIEVPAAERLTTRVATVETQEDDQ